MKKLFFSLIVLFFLSLFLGRYYVVYSQTPTPLVPIPGVSCGNAEATESAVIKCCQKINVSLPTVPSVLNNIPVVATMLEKLNQFMMVLDRAQNMVPCVIGYPTDPADPNCICQKESQITPSPIEAIKKMCQDYVSSNEKGNCEACANNGGAWTSIGCVYGDFSKFITEVLLGWGVGLAGLIALLCIIYSVFQMQTSQGNPEKIKKAQELLTSCIMGLMLIIFAIFILRLIGVDILRIPGFSE